MSFHPRFGVHFQPQEKDAFPRPCGCRVLLEGLYLFTLYALRCLAAFRHPRDYLGICLLLAQLSLYRFYPIITDTLLYQATHSLSAVLAKSPIDAVLLAITNWYRSIVFSACDIDWISASRPCFIAHSLSVACVKSNSVVIAPAFYPMLLAVSRKLSISFHPGGMSRPRGRIISAPMRCPWPQCGLRFGFPCLSV